MDIGSKIIQIAIFALFLGTWELYGKPLYFGWVKSQGAPLGLGEVSLGYFIFLSLATIVSTLITWRMRKRGD